MPSKVPVVFHNGSNYDYHFIIKELANELKRQSECQGGTEKYKKRKDDKDGNEYIMTISYNIKFIDSVRFKSSSLANLVNNPAEVLQSFS